MPVNNNLESEIEEALNRMSEHERTLLRIWCNQQGISEEVAILRLASGELERRLKMVFSGLQELNS